MFINSLKATDNFAYITPHIDYQERIKNKELLQNNLDKRKSKIVLNKIENLWSVYEDLKTRKLQLEERKSVVSKELGVLIKAEQQGNHVEKLKIQNSLLKENINKLKIPLWSAEEAAVVEALKLPNELHSLTPCTNKNIIYEYGSKPSNNKNHRDIGEKLNILQHTQNGNYYLKSDAALFELGAKFYFSGKLKQNNYTQFSNPDFSKSLIIEGCGVDHTDPNATFILHHNEDSKINIDNRLHLTGAGSLFSFLAYYAKNILHGKSLPLKYFSLGRQYIPSNPNETSLLHTSQSSVVQLFGITKNSTDADIMLQETIEIVKKLYGELGYHFRLSYVPACELNMWESLRLAIEMYSSSLQSYVEIGNISISDDFISKRLMIMYDHEKQHKFPHLISGTVLNIPKFLACALEQDGDFILPEQFKVENWIK
ncbi:unnamed protein product [Danaus chrysippus]|uniref:serine--tRNA ligase n=1 Tax=Danaus chrysippus TaxID=151541 RepID=A0A8J2QCD5_9NEOP|nr:unnamed protein product [Danaus chrysippus]